MRDEIQDPALRFDRHAFETRYGGRKAGTQMNNTLPAEYYAKQRAWRLTNAIRRLTAQRRAELCALDPTPIDQSPDLEDPE